MLHTVARCGANWAISGYRDVNRNKELSAITNQGGRGFECHSLRHGMKCYPSVRKGIPCSMSAAEVIGSWSRFILTGRSSMSGTYSRTPNTTAGVRG